MNEKKTGLKIKYSNPQNIDAAEVICSGAADQEKCQLFVERLALHSSSLDRASDRI